MIACTLDSDSESQAEAQTEAQTAATDRTTKKSSASPPGQTEISLREQKKSRTRKLILDSAQELINSDGYANTKMRDVAAAAEMSYQTLYNYFPTKGLILRELLTRDLIKLNHSKANTLNSKLSLSAKLRELNTTYLDAISNSDRDLWKEVCAELIKGPSHHSCLLDLIDQHANLSLREALLLSQNASDLDAHVDCNVLAQIFFNLIDANLMRYLINEKSTRAGVLRDLNSEVQLSLMPYVR